MDSLMAYLQTYWQQLLIGGLGGLILGWLITWLAMRSTANQLRATIQDLTDKLTASDRSLAEMRRQAQTLQASMATCEANLAKAHEDLDQAQADLDQAQADREQVVSEKAQVESSLEGHMRELDDLNAAYLQLEEQNSTLRANLEGSAAEAAAVQEQLDAANDTLETKEIALNEAYLRAVRLQRELMETQGVLVSTQTDLGDLRRDVVALTTYNQDLENKLQNARGDVAGELALLTSTMLRLKEDQLKDANLRIAALSAEVEAMKAGKVRGG
jgi:chromosome segregation ATPase